MHTNVDRNRALARQCAARVGEVKLEAKAFVAKWKVKIGYVF
jgi:hypothetical protein